MPSKKYVVVNMEFFDKKSEKDGIGFSQFILPDEQKAFKDELKWMKSENFLCKDSVKRSEVCFTEEEIVFQLDAPWEWQPKEWRTKESAPCIEVSEYAELTEVITRLKQFYPPPSQKRRGGRKRRGGGGGK